MRLFHSGMVRQHAKVAVSPTCQHQRGNPVNHDQRGQDQWPDPPTTGVLSWHRPGGGRYVWYRTDVVRQARIFSAESAPTLWTRMHPTALEG